MNIEKLEECPSCGERIQWVYDAQYCRACGLDRMRPAPAVGRVELLWLNGQLLGALIDAAGMLEHYASGRRPNNWDGSTRTQTLSTLRDCQAVIAAARGVERAATPPPLNVTVEVDGGIAEVTQCPAGVDVRIIDHDNLEAEREAEGDGKPMPWPKFTGRNI